jgi:hypothetical protein
MGRVSNIVYFLLSVFIFFASVSSIHAQTTWPHVEQEIIVRYKSGLSPEELSAKIAERKKKGEAFIIGPIRVWMENMKLAFSKKEIPEVHLSIIESVEDSIAVSDIEVLFQEEGVPNIYLVKYSSTENIERVVKMFQSIPEVEFAEPNYIYEELGI